jgi:hypothetical protein
MKLAAKVLCSEKKGTYPRCKLAQAHDPKLGIALASPKWDKESGSRQPQFRPSAERKKKENEMGLEFCLDTLHHQHLTFFYPKPNKRYPYPLPLNSLPSK